MGLLDDLSNPERFAPPHRRYDCVMCATIATLEPKEGKALAAVLANKNISANTIVRILKQHNLPGSRGTVSKHRNGECRGSK